MKQYYFDDFTFNGLYLELRDKETIHNISEDAVVAISKTNNFRFRAILLTLIFKFLWVSIIIAMIDGEIGITTLLIMFIILFPVTYYVVKLWFNASVKYLVITTIGAQFLMRYNDKKYNDMLNWWFGKINRQDDQLRNIELENLV